MSLPESPAVSVPRHEQWKVWEIRERRSQDGTAVHVRIKDRLFLNDNATSEYRERNLSPAKVLTLRTTTAKKTFRNWETLIHTEAK